MSGFEVTAVLRGEKGVYLLFLGQNSKSTFEATLMGFF